MIDICIYRPCTKGCVTNGIKYEILRDTHNYIMYYICCLNAAERAMFIWLVVGVGEFLGVGLSVI